MNDDLYVKVFLGDFAFTNTDIGFGTITKIKRNKAIIKGCLTSLTL